MIDKTWGTPPLVWALTGWRREPATGAGRYHEVVARLVVAVAFVVLVFVIVRWRTRSAPKAAPR